MDIKLTGSEATVLGVLARNARAYGLQIVEESEGVVKRASVYVLLTRLTKKGFVESEYEDAPSGEQGPPRRFYKLTGHGARVLRAYERFAAALAGACPE